MPYGLQKKKNHLAWALTMDQTIYSNLGLEYVWLVVKRSNTFHSCQTWFLSPHQPVFSFQQSGQRREEMFRRGSPIKCKEGNQGYAAGDEESRPFPSHWAGLMLSSG